MGCVWAANLVIYSQAVNTQFKGFEATWGWGLCQVFWVYLIPLITPLIIFLGIIFMIYSGEVDPQDFPAWASDNFHYVRN